MPGVTLFDGTPLPPIGLGTWAMGGQYAPDYRQDARALAAIDAALAMGYAHIDTAEQYAHGHAEELVGQALSEVDRDRVFITTKVRPPNLSNQLARESIDGSLQRLGVDVIDLLLIHWRDSTPLVETFGALNEAVHAGKVRHLGVSSFKLEDIREAQALSATPIVTNQVPYSVETRTYVQNGVIRYCQENSIVVTAYSPVEEGRLHVEQALTEIATTHEATPHQIALAWLVQQPWVITIPMSHNPVHLQQNLEAAKIQLSDAEMDRLTRLNA